MCKWPNPPELTYYFLARTPTPPSNLICSMLDVLDLGGCLAQRGGVHCGAKVQKWTGGGTVCFLYSPQKIARTILLTSNLDEPSRETDSLSEKANLAFAEISGRCHLHRRKAEVLQRKTL